MTRVHRMLQKQSLFYKKTTFTTSHFQGFFKVCIKTSNNGTQVTRDAKIGSNELGEGLEIMVTSKKPQREDWSLHSLLNPRVEF